MGASGGEKHISVLESCTILLIRASECYSDVFCFVGTLRRVVLQRLVEILLWRSSHVETCRMFVGCTLVQWDGLVLDHENVSPHSESQGRFCFFHPHILMYLPVTVSDGDLFNKNI